jgi:hypothetical protein
VTGTRSFADLSLSQRRTARGAILALALIALNVPYDVARPL